MGDFSIFVISVLGAALALITVNYTILKRSFLADVGMMMISISAWMALLTYFVAIFGIEHLFWALPLGVGSVVLSLYFIIKRVRKPFFTILNTLDNLASGHMEVEFDERVSKRRDEIGRVFRSFSRYVDKIKRATLFASEIGSGNLNAEFTVAGDNDSLGNSLVKMRDNLRTVIEDAKAVVKDASEEGKLEARISTDEKEGAWKDLGDALNNLLSSFSGPLLNLNKIIVSMAEGDLTHRYTAEAKGDILRMAENLNSALDNIDGLLNQVSKNAIVIEESTSEMKVSSEEMSTNTNEIASSITEMSNGAQMQVSKVDEASSLIEGILTSSKEMGSKSETIHYAAKQGVESSEQGLQLVTNVVNDMGSISTFAHKTSDSIQVLTERSNEITRVLGVITDIASQTNLLALNAAIEAAQAGDAGRGFAVVAEEIRKLAEDSKKSAKEIETLVLDVQTDTTQASKVMEEMVTSVRSGEETSKVASEAFKEILKSSNETLKFSEEILNATEQQIKDINDVVAISESIVVIAEETAAGTEQIASSATELSSGMSIYNQKTLDLANVAESFKEGVSMLKLSAAGSDNTVIFGMKEAYEKEKSLLDALLNNIPDFIYFKDMESRFIRNSLAHIKRFGCEKQEELLGKTDFDYHGEHARVAFEDEQRIIKTREPMINVVQKADLKDTGKSKYLSTTKMPLLNVDGEVIGTFGVSRDVTDFKMTEIELQKKADQLTECEEEKQKLVKQLEKKA